MSRRAPISDAVYHVIATAKEPLSVEEIKAATGLTRQQALNAAAHLAFMGKVCSVRDWHGAKYSVKKNISPNKENVAGRIEIPQYRWGATRLG